MFEALHYKPEGRGFDSRCDNWIYSFWPHYGPWVGSACNINLLELGSNGGRHLGLTTLIPSCAVFSKNSGRLKLPGPQGSAQGIVYFSVIFACSFIYIYIYIYIEICAHNKHTNYTLLHLPKRDTSVKTTGT